MSNYKENRERVFEIYGVRSTDKKFNCHHCVFKRDVKNGTEKTKEDLNTV